MLVLSALCVLLPLAAALDTCDDKTAKAFLAKKQLDGDLLHNVSICPLFASYFCLSIFG